VKERIALPLDEWEVLLGFLPGELRERYEGDRTLDGGIGLIQREGAAVPSVVHREWAGLWEKEALSLLGPWLRHEGPVSLGRIGAVFGVSPGEAEDAADALALAGELVRDVVLAPAPGAPGESREADPSGTLVCDRENLELLLRLSRKKARPAVRERPAAFLTPYLALRQGLLPRRRDPAETGDESRGEPWKTLTCFAAPAALWEGEFFPARFPGYRPEILDRELGAGRLLWYGAGKERAGYCLPEDLDLVFPEDPGPPFSAAFPPDLLDSPRDFWEIRDRLGLDIPSCVKLLWDAAWAGRISADSWEPLRGGLRRGWTPDIPGASLVPAGGGRSGGTGRRRLPRALRDRWKQGSPVRGRWFSLAPVPGDSPDPLDEEELNRDRVRLLLARWGVLCRPLLEREAGPLSWGRLLPAMRRLELAGELTAGRFFAGINSLQFASPAIAGELEAAEAERGIYWMNAADPASPSGPAAGGDRRLPARIGSARICFRGAEPLAVSGRNGGDLSVFIPPDDPCLPEALAFLEIPRTRAVDPRRKIVLETINGGPAAESPYGEILKSRGFLPDRGTLTLW
jgi:ATP-dependent Lhr-like helicase